MAFISIQPLQYLPAPYILEAQWLSKPWKNEGKLKMLSTGAWQMAK